MDRLTAKHIKLLNDNGVYKELLLEVRDLLDKVEVSLLDVFHTFSDSNQLVDLSVDLVQRILTDVSLEDI